MQLIMVAYQLFPMFSSITQFANIRFQDQNVKAEKECSAPDRLEHSSRGSATTMPHVHLISARFLGFLFGYLML